jgi:subtilisin family serine protease
MARAVLLTLAVACLASTALRAPNAPAPALAAGARTAVAALPLRPVVRLSALEASGALKHARLSSPLVELTRAAARAGAAGAPVTGEAIGARASPALRGLLAAGRLRLSPAGDVQVYVAVDKVTPELAVALEARGARIERAGAELGLVQAWVPIGWLDDIAGLPQVRSVRLPEYAVRSAGAVTTEGDAVVGAAALREAFPGLDGSGITIGVISDGVRGVRDSQATADLPSIDITTCNVTGTDPELFGAEGTAMLEIVHDLAPRASLMFGNFGFSTGLAFNDAVDCLAANTDIVVDDIGFFGAGPYDGTSFISANTAAALNGPGRIRGYYTAVGNQAGRHYQGRYRASELVIAAGTDVWVAHHFDADDEPLETLHAGLVQAPATFNRFRLDARGVATISVVWDDPWGASANDYDLFFGDGTDIFPCSLNEQNGDDDPTETCSITNTSTTRRDIDIYITNYFGAADPRTFDLFLICPGCPLLSNGNSLDFNTEASSIGNQADAGGAPAPVVSAGAVRQSNPDAVQRYSGRGPTEDGRLKPDVVAPDGVCVTASGGFVPGAAPCQGGAGRRFFGTSAAAPHVAGVAALLLQCSPTLHRAGLYDLLTNTAADLPPEGADQTHGHGLIDALAAAGAADHCGLATNTPTATPTITSTPLDSPTPTITRTPTRTRTPTPTPRPPLGDVNCDRRVNAIDAALILQRAAGLTSALPCLDYADLNRDGRADAIDAALILQFVAGLIERLPR